jgi:hypothetical protein
MLVLLLMLLHLARVPPHLLLLQRLVVLHC